MKAKQVLIGLSIVILLFASMQIQAAPDQGITYEYKNGIAKIETANVTVSVNALGSIPTFHYKLVSGYSVNVMFKQLHEYQDLNADGAFQYNESLVGTPPLSLSSIQWTFSGFDVEENGGVTTAAHFNFTSDTIIGAIYNDLEITIAMHLYLEDQVIEGYELMGGAEFKFDIYINGWPWQEVDSLLALRFDITPENGSQCKNQSNQVIDTTVNTTNNEQKLVEKANQIKQILKFEKDGNGAFFGYANQSRIRNTYESQYRYGSVNASHSSTGDGILQIFLSFEHADSIIYDPSIGTDDSGVAETAYSWIAAVILPLLAIAIVRVSYYFKRR